MKAKTPCPVCNVNVVINRYNGTIHGHARYGGGWCPVRGISLEEAMKMSPFIFEP